MAGKGTLTIKILGDASHAVKEIGQVDNASGKMRDGFGKLAVAAGIDAVAGLDWDDLRARLDEPVGHPDRLVDTGEHFVITCGRTVACTCGDRHEERTGIAAGRVQTRHAITHAPWQETEKR